MTDRAEHWTTVEVGLSQTEATYLGWLAIARGTTIPELVRRGLRHLPISGDDRRGVAQLRYDAELARMDQASS